MYFYESPKAINPLGPTSVMLEISGWQKPCGCVEVIDNKDGSFRLRVDKPALSEKDNGSQLVTVRLTTKEFNPVIITASFTIEVRYTPLAPVVEEVEVDLDFIEKQNETIAEEEAEIKSEGEPIREPTVEQLPRSDEVVVFVPVVMRIKEINRNGLMVIGFNQLMRIPQFILDFFSRNSDSRVLEGLSSIDVQKDVFNISITSTNDEAELKFTPVIQSWDENEITI